MTGAGSITARKSPAVGDEGSADEQKRLAEKTNVEKARVAALWEQYQKIQVSKLTKPNTPAAARARRAAQRRWLQIWCLLLEHRDQNCARTKSQGPFGGETIN